jgi:hypothetical protein
MNLSLELIKCQEDGFEMLLTIKGLFDFLGKAHRYKTFSLIIEQDILDTIAGTNSWSSDEMIATFKNNISQH